MAKKDKFSIMEHDWQSQAYVDEWIRRDVQQDDQRRPHLRKMFEHVHFAQDKQIDVLDVGGGFGVATEELLRAFPHARVVVMDYSQPMLGHARSRLACYTDQIRYVLADLREHSWTERVGGPFDLVISGWAIHNLADSILVSACYRGIARLLKPGCAFLNYDLVDHVGGTTLHSRLLREAGFVRVRCLWHQAPAAIYVAYANAIRQGGG